VPGWQLVVDRTRRSTGRVELGATHRLTVLHAPQHVNDILLAALVQRRTHDIVERGSIIIIITLHEMLAHLQYVEPPTTRATRFAEVILRDKDAPIHTNDEV
jgi:hypothetical protein